eukprot:776167-Prymnesium_polylepis.1
MMRCASASPPRAHSSVAGKTGDGGSQAPAQETTTSPKRPVFTQKTSSVEGQTTTSPQRSPNSRVTRPRLATLQLLSLPADRMLSTLIVSRVVEEATMASSSSAEPDASQVAPSVVRLECAACGMMELQTARFKLR